MPPMALVSGGTELKKLSALKAQLKEWETTFAAQHHRRPTNKDIDVTPEIKAKYKEYNRIKRAKKPATTTFRSTAASSQSTAATTGTSAPLPKKSEPVTVTSRELFGHKSSRATPQNKPWRRVKDRNLPSTLAVNWGAERAPPPLTVASVKQTIVAQKPKSVSTKVEKRPKQTQRHDGSEVFGSFLNKNSTGTVCCEEDSEDSGDESSHVDEEDDLMELLALQSAPSSAVLLPPSLAQPASPEKDSTMSKSRLFREIKKCKPPTSPAKDNQEDNVHRITRKQTGFRTLAGLADELVAQQATVVPLESHVPEQPDPEQTASGMDADEDDWANDSILLETSAMEGIAEARPVEASAVEAVAVGGLGDPQQLKPRKRKGKAMLAWDSDLVASFGETAVQTASKSNGLVSTNFRRLNLRRGKGGAKAKYTKAYKRKNHRNFISRKGQCHTCGDEGHWASDCPLDKPFCQKQAEEEIALLGYDDSERPPVVDPKQSSTSEKFDTQLTASQLNAMKVYELRQSLQEIGQETEGTRPQLLKRLKSHLNLSTKRKSTGSRKTNGSTTTKKRRKTPTAKSSKKKKAQVVTDSPMDTPVEMPMDAEDCVVSETQKETGREDLGSDLVDSLKTFCGFEAFRPGQREAIERVLQQKSTLLVLSTGSGKSLCYQLPTFVYKWRDERTYITIVVSPLVSLMEDQITRLPKKLRGATLNSSMSLANRDKIKSALFGGKIDVLFISPETLTSASFARITRQTGFPTVGFVCIDEVHCVSHWSHNFRPAYLRLAMVVSQLFGSETCLLGLTATATPQTEVSIVEQLGIPEDGVIRGSPVPKNLLLSVSVNANRRDELARMLQSHHRFEKGATIVYAKAQADTENLAAFLRTCGLDADCYHGGMAGSRRKSVQKKFMAGRLRIVVATIAFGMGLDKSDVRCIIHFHAPKSGENYVQEIGRAGRDGQRSYCHMFLERDDLAVLRCHAHADVVDDVTVRHLVRYLFGHKEAAARATAAALKAVRQSPGADGLLRAKEADRAKLAAISTQYAEDELDIKEQVLATFLCWMEQIGHVHMRNPVPTTCRFRVNSQEFAACDPLLAAVVAASTNCPASRWPREVDLVTVTNAVGLDFQDVVRHIYDCQGSGKIAMEMFGQAHLIEVPRDITPLEMDEMIQALCTKMHTLERGCLRKLDRFHNIMSTALDAEATEDQTRSEVMNLRIRDGLIEYFDDKQEQEVLNEAPEVDRSTVPADVIAHLRREIRQFIGSMGDEEDLPESGRVVARIFHGISSPKYPSSIWYKNLRWRRHIDYDFHLIRSLATEELIKFRLGDNPFK